jgi:Tol biopolymer transport system component
MPEAKELFESVTHGTGPEPGALHRQVERRRRAARNRKVTSVAVAAMVLALIVGTYAVTQRADRAPGPATTASPAEVHLRTQIVGLDGTSQRSIAGIPATAYQLAMAPNGDSIAWVRYQAFRPQIAITDISGADIQILTHGPGAEQPTWSPDGSQIAFASVVSYTGHAIFVMNADGSHVRRLTDGPHDEYPTWSPDGEHILFTRAIPNGQVTSLNLWTVPVAGGDATRLTTTHFRDPNLDFLQASYAPDGARIVQSSHLRLTIMDADGTHAHVVPRSPREGIWAPRWSPDGARIAFLTFVRRYVYAHVRGMNRVAVCVVNILDVASGRITTLPVKVATDFNAPVWVSNDTLLVHAIEP